MDGIYRFLMPANPEARLAAFSAFVRRALDEARVSRGLSVEGVARLAGIGVNTVYLWRNGTFKQYPLGESVEAFCDALNIPTSAAFNILWPGKSGKAASPEPIPPDPDFELLLRKLRDPAVSERERYLIRETIRGLALRPSASPDVRKRRDAG
jgi:transcriptional regulator with XRE-family HTH domain